MLIIHCSIPFYLSSWSNAKKGTRFSLVTNQIDWLRWRWNSQVFWISSNRSEVHRIEIRQLADSTHFLNTKCWSNWESYKLRTSKKKKKWKKRELCQKKKTRVHTSVFSTWMTEFYNINSDMILDMTEIGNMKTGPLEALYIRLLERKKKNPDWDHQSRRHQSLQPNPIGE